MSDTNIPSPTHDGETLAQSEERVQTELKKEWDAGATAPDQTVFDEANQLTDADPAFDPMTKVKVTDPNYNSEALQRNIGADPVAALESELGLSDDEG